MTETTAAAEQKAGLRVPPAVVSVVAPLVGVAIGLLLGALLIRIAGADPLEAYATMFKGAFGGKRQITETLLKTCPLLLIALGLTAAFRARVWNIGGEGQYFMGALVGSVVALSFPEWPRGLMLLTILLGGIVGGALWALIPALLKVRAGVNEIISTLMLNYIAILFVTYMARGPLQEPGGYLPMSAQLPIASKLPVLPGTRIHIGIFLVALLVPLVYYLLWHTPLGFRLRAVGSSASVARYAGFNVSRVIVFALVFSGALAGLAGMIEVTNVHFRLKAGISGGYGFSAVLVALLGRMNPFGVAIASLFFAALIVGAETMHVLAGLPPELSSAIQAVIVLSVLAVDTFARRRTQAWTGA